jgi:hypothetical protein
LGFFGIACGGPAGVFRVNANNFNTPSAVAGFSVDRACALA